MQNKFSNQVNLFILISLFMSLGVRAQANHETILLKNKLDSIFLRQSEQLPGLSVLVRKDNQIVFKQSKGLANSSSQISISSKTGFRLGSISKPFTALAIMKLIEQRRLTLNQSITDFITELPATWNNITIGHLLSHQVGISEDFFADSNLQLANQSSNKDVVNFLSTEKIRVTPLSTQNGIYCNSCYVLLAEVITKASGVSFAEYIGVNIFTPANMNGSYIVEKGVPIKNGDALNYAIRESFFGIHQYTTGAMAQVSSIEDLNHFIIALKSNKVIGKEMLARMTSFHTDLGEDGRFGLGWMVGWGLDPFFSHGGSQDGYQSELFFYPKYDLEIVILSNGGEKTYELQSQIMRATMSHFIP